jgi:hypothetical protein
MSYNKTRTRRRTIRNLLAGLEGRFVSVTFAKKDGTIRKLTIQPHAVETHRAVNPSQAGLKAARTRLERYPNLLPVYDVTAGRIKSINLDKVSSIRVDKSELLVMEGAA